MGIRAFIISAACSLTLLSGCAVGLDYVRPDTSGPQSYKEAGSADTSEADWRLAAPGAPDAGFWWEVFGDPVLNRLMEELGRANQNIQIGLANLRQALAQVREARASFFPVLTLNSSVSRGTSGSADSGSGINGVSVQAPRIRNSYSAGLEASWEPDIWGGVRRSVEGSQAQARGMAADLGAVILSMRAELATNYFQARTLDSMIEMYARTVEAYRRTLSITENQYAAGTVTRADAAQARAQLKAAEAQLVDARLQRAQVEHAIANLLGRAPAEFSLAPGRLPERVPRIDAGVPAVLLERRPDVAEAEQQVVAANAAIGVAESAYFPLFSFAVSGGYAGNAFSRWFTSPNEFWALGPAAAMTLFQGGALIARTDQARAAWEAAVANYRQSVLQAFNDVEDALAAMRLLREEEVLQQEALAAARDAERMLLNQYKAGVVTYVSVATAQATALNDAVLVEQLRGARFAAAVSLIRALGGGWSMSELEASGEGETKDAQPLQVPHPQTFSPPEPELEGS